VTNDEREYIRYLMDRSRECLVAAGALVVGNHLHDAVNRIYYGCMNAALALLLTEGFNTRKHSEIASQLNLRFIKPGVLPRKLGRFYHRMFEERLRGDYGRLVAYDPTDVTAWLDDANGFVERVLEKATVRLKANSPQETPTTPDEPHASP
jgi:uncharacterized protein (UPF0332 family)